MLFLRSALFALFQATTAIVFSIIAILVLPLPFVWRYKIVSRWAVVNLWCLDKVCNLRFEVKGQDNIPDSPCIIMCKHQSAWETLALQAVFPAQAWVLKRELLWLPFFGWGLAALNPIAIDRGAGRQAMKQVIEQGKQRLDDGVWVVIFPEGTRVPTGYMGRFGLGAARLAIESGHPVLPVAHNAGTFWAKQGFIKHPGVVKLVIGSTIDMTDKTAAQLNHEVYQWMENEMTQLENAKPEKILLKEQRGQ